MHVGDPPPAHTNVDLWRAFVGLWEQGERLKSPLLRDKMPPRNSIPPEDMSFQTGFPWIVDEQCFVEILGPGHSRIDVED